MNEGAIASLLNPSSIAIVGASPSKHGEYQFNSAPLQFLMKYSFRGNVYPINPKYSEVEGYKCYPSLLDVPGEIDVALLIISAKYINTVLTQCEQKGVKSIIISASGFAEMGEEGKESQLKLKEFSERTGIPILGPNTLGLVNVIKGIPIGFSVALEGDLLNKGNIGFVSQSGATMSSIVRRAKEKGLGFSYMVDTGNEGVLEIADFIEFLLDDDRVEVIMVVAESVKNIEKFKAAAEKALKMKKPIVILKMGRSIAGKITAMSHTGSMAGSSEINDALYKQKNIIVVRDIDDMLTTVELLSYKFNVDSSKGIGIASTSGGGAGLTADLLESAGLVVSKLSESSTESLKSELNSFVQAQNPFDFAGQFIKDSEIGEKVFNIFAKDENTSLLLFTLHPVQKHSLKLIKQMVNVHKETNFPFILLWMGESLEHEEVECLRNGNIPFYTNMSSCVRAIANLFNYYNYLNKVEANDSSKVEKYEVDHSTLTNLLANSKKSTLSERESKYLFAQYGLSVTKEKLATNVEEAIKIANEIGYPVAMKIEAEHVLHKTDIGGVKLGIKNDYEVQENYHIILQNFMNHHPGSSADGIVVQKMIEDDGIDFILGMKNDPECGPTILFGLGGIFTEVMKEYSLSVLPVNSFEIDLMLQDSKFNKFFEGYRGMQVNYTAIKNFILRFAQFCWDYKDQIEEVDINPVRVSYNGSNVIALDGLVQLKSNNLHHEQKDALTTNEK